ncbi:outer envelope protein 64, chloroplastic [Populus alba]|uniref:Toc64 family protein n=2 Tax=Populus TaxID=3689 RepID=A0A4U5M5B4_POPAL|nr:outer envelope protein 64, chloroplastic-like [Populus alba]KAJ6977034.1 outer envelope protein 64 [Populus alba x Populus x berolinensis]TKR63962.1 Toc64 family protein [Populus alba]
MASNSANLWVLLGLGLAGILLMTKKFKKSIIRQDFGAFIEKLLLVPPPQPPPPKAPHPLTALTFAVSDLFEIEGYVSGFGHPEWAKTHQAASQTSLVVSTLVDGGATCVGKTVIDELAYSIHGENKHYGTPINPVVPTRVTGGSCSGAAVAVAANLVDFSLGVDTVGGVRVPAGYCGVIGFRPSYGAISKTGVLPVSASLDTVGWFAKDPNILRRVGHVLLQPAFGGHRSPRQIIMADDCFQLLKIPVDRVAQVVFNSTEKHFGRQVLKHEILDVYLNSKVPSLKEFHNKKTNGEVKTSSIRLLAHVMQLLHRYEFRSNHEEWINTEKPILEPDFSAQMNEIMKISEAEIELCKSIREEMRLAISSLLKDDGILVVPTMAYLPPKLDGKEILSEEYQSSSFSLLSIASLSGCCQVTVPLGYYDKCPVSVSLIARHGNDRFLLDTLQTMYASLQEQAETHVKSKSRNTDSEENSAEMAKEKGNQAFKEKQWKKAISYYNEAIKLNDKNATYYSNRAAAYLELGSFHQAEADCSEAINLDKKNVKAYLRRGTAREMLGYYKDAIEDFKYALVLEPTNKRASLSAERLRKVFPVGY